MNTNQQNQIVTPRSSYEVTMPFLTNGVKKLSLLTYIISFALIPHLVFAQVTLYLSPMDVITESETYAEGQIIEAKVLVDTGGDTIGVGEGSIRFSSEHLEVVDISRELSIFSLWVEEPQAVGNILRFVGGVPGGFFGRGEIFSVTFKTKTDVTTNVLFDSARTLSFTAQPKNVLKRTGDAWYPFEIPVAVPKSFLFEKELAEGNRNIDVAYLQIVLTSEQLYDKDITGQFDKETKRAVEQFQGKYADVILTPQGRSAGTGIVRALTRLKLNVLVPELKEMKKPTLFDVLVAPEGEEVPARVAVLLIVAAGVGIALAFALVVSVPKIRRWWAAKKRRRDNESDEEQ